MFGGRLLGIKLEAGLNCCQFHLGGFGYFSKLVLRLDNHSFSLVLKEDFYVIRL